MMGPGEERRSRARLTLERAMVACLAVLMLGALAGCGSDEAERSRRTHTHGDDSADQRDQHDDRDGQEEKPVAGAGGLVVLLVESWNRDGTPGGIRLDDIRGGTLLVPLNDPFLLIEEPPIIEEMEGVEPARLKPGEGGKDRAPLSTTEVRITLRVSQAGPDAPPLTTIDDTMSAPRPRGTGRWLRDQLDKIGRNKQVREKVPVIVEAEPQVAWRWVAQSVRTAETAGFKHVRLAASKRNLPKFARKPDRGAPKAPDVKPDLGGRLIITVRRVGEPPSARRRRDVISVGKQRLTLRDVEQCLRREKELREKRPRRAKRPVLVLADKDASWRTVQDIIEKAVQIKLAPVWLRAAERPK